MESISSERRESVLDALSQIEIAIERLLRWNKDLDDLYTLLESEQGMQILAANCMLIMSIGEGFKKIDRITDGALLPMQPQVPWHAVISMRNHIAHGYFDIDVDVISRVIQNDLHPLLDATNELINIVQNLKIK